MQSRGIAKVYKLKIEIFFNNFSLGSTFQISKNNYNLEDHHFLLRKSREIYLLTEYVPTQLKTGML